MKFLNGHVFFTKYDGYKFFFENLLTNIRKFTKKMQNLVYFVESNLDREEEYTKKQINYNF